jgi:hypothetical protein
MVVGIEGVVMVAVEAAPAPSFRELIGGISIASILILFAC